jgi:hypothetical protein
VSEQEAANKTKRLALRRCFAGMSSGGWHSKILKKNGIRVIVAHHLRGDRYCHLIYLTKMIQVIRTSAEDLDFVTLIEELDKDIENAMEQSTASMRSLTKRTA